MALFQTQAFSRRLRIGLTTLLLVTNVIAGAQINAQIQSPAAIPPQQIPQQLANSITEVAPSTEAQTGPAFANQTSIDPTTCLPASWVPFDNTTFIVPGGTVSTQVVVSVTSSAAIDASTAAYALYTPSGGNSAWASAVATQLGDFTVVMTATNVTVTVPSAGALSSVQFRISRKNKISSDADACSPVHNVFAASQKIYLPIIFKESGPNNKDITNIEEPNNTTCQSYAINPNVKYTARLNDKEDLFKLSVATTSTLSVIVTGFTTAGQLQVRKSSGKCDTGELYTTTSYQGDPVQTRQLIVFNVLPGDVYVRVASPADIAPNTDYSLIVTLNDATTPTGPFEPNNSACQAYPIALNTTYQAYPEDNSDWYSFTLASSTNLSLSLTNLIVTVGQYSLYKTDDCSTINAQTTTPVTRQDPKITPAINLGSQPAGKYFLRVAVGSGANSTSLYSLRVSTNTTIGATPTPWHTATPANTNVWSPQGEVCGVNGCNRTASAGETLKVFWRGMPGLTSLKLKITTKQIGNLRCYIFCEI